MHACTENSGVATQAKRPPAMGRTESSVVPPWDLDKGHETLEPFGRAQDSETPR